MENCMSPVLVSEMRSKSAQRGPSSGRKDREVEKKEKKNQDCSFSQIQPEWLSYRLRDLSAAGTLSQTQIYSIYLLLFKPTLVPVPSQAKIPFNSILPSV